MDKMMWSKPEMNEFAFAANEYVAACGDPLRTIYNFICTSLAGVLYYYDDNGSQQYLGPYKPCNFTHQVTVNAGEQVPFYEGFVDRGDDSKPYYDPDRYPNGKEDSGEHAAVWIEWKEYEDWDGNKYQYADDWHAMDVLSVDQIEADKS